MPNIKQTAKDNPIVIAGVNKDKLYAEHKTHSAVIRHLNSLGYARADIARFLGKIYQHVKNVLDQEIQRKLVAEEQAVKAVARQKKEKNGKVKVTATPKKLAA